MTSERQSVKFCIKIGVLLLILAQFQSAVKIKRKSKKTRQKRGLESEDNEENSENAFGSHKRDIEDEEEEEEEREEIREVGNIYEAKMIEFEDEIEGQYYLQAISWEDRYWLDFHNLMLTVKGK